MKDIVTYINEVSKGLAQRAYNKASGAQKNRLKKLYKEIYGSDISESDVSHIKFVFNNQELVDAYGGEEEIKAAFTMWPQNILDNIHKIEFDYDYDASPSYSDNEYNDAEFSITIDGKKYYEEYQYSNKGDKIIDSSLSYKHNEANLFEFIANLYKEKYS